MRRICLIGAAIAAGPLTIGVAVLPAVSAAAAAKPAPAAKVVKLTCRMSLTEQAPAGDTSVTPAAEKGTQYGTVACGKVFGGDGAQFDGFTLQDTGNLTGKYKQYFGTGTIHGAYMLTPAQSDQPSTTTFATQSYTGTYSILGGSGAFQGARGKATIKCTTADGIHMDCVERLKLKAL